MRNTPSTPLIPLLALIAGAVLIGMSPIYVRLSELGPVATAFYRVFFSVPIFLLLETYRIQQTTAPKQFSTNSGSLHKISSAYAKIKLRDWLLLAGLGLFYALDLITWHWSLQYIYVANSTLLANLAVIFVIPLGWLFFGRKIRAISVLYASGAFVGVIMLSWGNLDNLNNLKGVFWGIMAAFSYALYILLASKLRSSINVIQQMTWTGIFASLFILPFLLWQGESLAIMSLYSLVILLGLGITSQVMGQGFIVYSLAYITPAVATLVLLLQPVVAAVMGWVFFTEALTLIQILGALVIMIFVYLARNVEQKP